MTDDAPPVRDRLDIEEFLVLRGADRMAHPGGTLLEHLRRVATLLLSWGADPAVEVAGLCHACYGTDGYDHPLIEVAERNILIQLIGSPAEALVYLYGSCDRNAVYPWLAGSAPVPFRDRFTGRTVTPIEREVRGFIEITAANEIDVVRHNPALAAEHGPGLFRLFKRARHRLSEAAWLACQEAFGDRRTPERG
jgi:hypothetical protein